MGYSKLVTFDSNKYRQRLDNLGIKLSELSKPKSIYYTEYTYSTINKAFKTGKINPDLLHKLDLIIQYTSDPDKKNPTILNIVASDLIVTDLKRRNEILQKDFDEQNTEAIAEVKRLKEELRHLSTDLVKYSASFERASKYLKHVVDESCF